MPAVHVAFVEPNIVTAVDNYGEMYVTAASRYRWVCSTCQRKGSWTARKDVAASSASRHVARPGSR